MILYEVGWILDVPVFKCVFTFLDSDLSPSPTGGLFGQHGFRDHLVHVTQTHHRLGDAAGNDGHHLAAR